MRSTFGYASIWCILLHQLQQRDSIAPITRGVPNAFVDDKLNSTLNIKFVFNTLECIEEKWEKPFWKHCG